MMDGRLYLAGTLFEAPLERQRLVYAPDFPGLPLLLSEAAGELIDRFRDGATVDSVMAEGGDDTIEAAIEALSARGVLRDKAVRLPYEVEPAVAPPRDLCVWLHVTNVCNLRCSYCFVGEKTKSEMALGTMQTVSRALAHTAHLYSLRNIFIKFAGGEPSANLDGMRQFYRLLSLALQSSDIAVHYEMLCNGTILSEGLLRFIREADIGVSISLDGYGAAHDIHRVFASGKGSWDLITRNIDRLLEAGIRVNILATISIETCESLPQLVEWVLRKSLPVRLQVVVRNPESDWRGADRQQEYADMNARMAGAFAQTFRQLEFARLQLDLRSALAICELQIDYPSSGVTCGIGSNMIVVRPDGRLASCPMTVNEIAEPCDFDLLRSAARTFVHSSQDRLSVGSGDDCRQCQWFRVCASGCPVTNNRIAGHPFSRSPLCSFYKSVIPDFLRFFGTMLVQSQAQTFAASDSAPTDIVPGMIFGYRQAYF